MMPSFLRLSADSVAFRLYLSSDHRTPATGKTPTVTISKAAGSFASPAGTVSERGGGWYTLAATSADLSTLGPLILHATAAGCDPADLLGWVTASAGADPLTSGVASPIPFLMVSTSDGVSPAIGLSPSATVYWPGGTTLTGTATEIGLGWYAITGTPPLGGTAEVAATAPGAATTGGEFQVAGATSTPPALSASAWLAFFATPSSTGSPANFPRAIIARWAAQGLAGTLMHVKLPPGAECPTSTFTIKRGSPCLLTSNSSVYDYTVTFLIRDLDEAAAHDRAMAVDEAFNRASVIWTAGWAALATQESWTNGAESSDGPGQPPPYFHEIRYRWRAKGAR